MKVAFLVSHFQDVKTPELRFVVTHSVNWSKVLQACIAISTQIFTVLLLQQVYLCILKI